MLTQWGQATYIDFMEIDATIAGFGRLRRSSAVLLCAAVALAASGALGPGSSLARGEDNADAPAAEVLRRMQTSEDPRTRAAGMEVRSAAGNTATAWSLLLDPDAANRSEALAALGAADQRELAEGFIAVLGRQQGAAARALARHAAPLSPRLTSPLVETLTDPGAPLGTRSTAARALGLLRAEASGAALARTAWSNPPLAPACARALCAMEHASARRYLAALCRHPDPDVRRWAVEGLARLGGAEAREALHAMLAGAESEPALRRQAAQALGQIGDEVSVGVLIDSLRQDEWTRAAVMAALRQRTGLDWGTSYRQWINWYDAKQRQERKAEEDRKANRPKVDPQSPLLPKVPPGFAPGGPAGGGGDGP